MTTMSITPTMPNISDKPRYSVFEKYKNNLMTLDHEELVKMLQDPHMDPSNDMYLKSTGISSNDYVGNIITEAICNHVYYDVQREKLFKYVKTMLDFGKGDVTLPGYNDMGMTSPLIPAMWAKNEDPWMLKLLLTHKDLRKEASKPYYINYVCEHGKANMLSTLLELSMVNPSANNNKPIKLLCQRHMCGDDGGQATGKFEECLGLLLKDQRFNSDGIHEAMGNLNKPYVHKCNRSSCTCVSGEVAYNMKCMLLNYQLGNACL